MRRVPWAAVAPLLLAALLLPAAQPTRKRSEAETKTAAELKALDEQIARQQRQLQQDAVEKDRLGRTLQDAERSVTRANGDLAALRRQRAERAAARRQLVEERSRRQAQREATEADLASQLRAAYFMGRNEPLKLLLNQRDPAEFGRNLTYYGYLGRLRADQIGEITANIARIDELKLQIDAEDAELAQLEAQQKGKVAELESARRERGKALASLQEQLRDRSLALNRMQEQRQQLDKLLKELSRAAEVAPFDPKTPFGQSRGKLVWPVAGRIVTNFGATIAGGLRSEGIDIDAAAGTEVRAVHEGVVRFADYLNGWGNVIIVSHGDGYSSVYGHNENLFKSVNAKVAAGEKIATVGDTGGRVRAGLLFQIRHNKDWVDPRPWFSSAAPPPR